MIDASSSPTTPFFGSFDFRVSQNRNFCPPPFSRIHRRNFLFSRFSLSPSLIRFPSSLSLFPTRTSPLHPLSSSFSLSEFHLTADAVNVVHRDSFSPGHLSSPSPNPYIFITDSSSPFLAPVVCVSSPSSACHRHCHHCFKRPRLLLHGSIALISLFAPLLDFFPKKVRKAGDPGNHSFAIFPTGKEVNMTFEFIENQINQF
ncbi:uncharacterized protein LOC128132259 isoform X1 [Lactuca sativa]|uniref:uncharacterized protein LOC128132258 isoform X1 n=1 Tax=Lactuca sativa TaxID=4236 RepID=UPI0022AF18FD|nr:uncharacterized protein LOC128132258 isoform X1 [Lactuca sativa]XP_052624695.1 uncharacterized protein LOC128132259 isoform X1 [Lactuca sativa]